MKTEKKTIKKVRTTKTIPVRYSLQALEEFDEAANRLEVSRLDAIRLSSTIGLRYLKKINFKLADAVLDFSERWHERL